jgi:hypothetical protein
MREVKKRPYLSAEELEDRRLWANGQRKANADHERTVSPDVRQLSRAYVDLLMPAKFGQ